MSDLINRQMAIDAMYETFSYAYCDNCEKEMNEDLCGDCHRKYQNWAASKKTISKTINNLPSAQPESYKEKLKEIADVLSEKFAYMNTCLNERDIILGYLGVKRPSKIHCNTDCTNIKCESHRCNKRLPSAQPKISCDGCKYRGRPITDMPCCACIRKEDNDYYDSE